MWRQSATLLNINKTTTFSKRTYVGYERNIHVHICTNIYIYKLNYTENQISENENIDFVDLAYP